MTKIDRITDYILRLNIGQENPSELFNHFKEDLLSIEPQEAFEVFRHLQKNYYSELEILPFLDKIVHVFYDNLKTNRPHFDPNNKYIQLMLEDNRLLEEKFDAIRPLMSKLNIPNVRHELSNHLENLKGFYPHYENKENTLFPLLESKDDKFNGLSIMWALHNEIKKEIDQSINLLKSPTASTQDVIESVSQLFFDMLGLIQKEENILYPAALEILSEDEWKSLSQQSLEYPGVFNTKEVIISNQTDLDYEFKDNMIHTETGILRIEEVLMIFNTLELDMTLVDEHNKVRYFTRPKDRIFPRSASVIGRDVNNCHPPQSVHIVQEIVENFRAGRQDKASFWIDMRGRKILIQYFALRDNQNNYKGVLEVSSDITEIQKLEGQQRLAQYDKNRVD